MTDKQLSPQLQKIEAGCLEDIQAVSADPGLLLEGAPQFRTSVQGHIDDGLIDIGIWDATPGMTRSVKGGKTEFCYIISGRVEITQDGEAPQVFGPGDAFMMKPDFVGTWRTIETVRKYFVIVDPNRGAGKPA